MIRDLLYSAWQIFVGLLVLCFLAACAASFVLLVWALRAIVEWMT